MIELIGIIFLIFLLVVGTLKYTSLGGNTNTEDIKKKYNYETVKLFDASRNKEKYLRQNGKDTQITKTKNLSHKYYKGFITLEDKEFIPDLITVQSEDGITYNLQTVKWKKKDNGKTFIKARRLDVNLL